MSDQQFYPKTKEKPRFDVSQYLAGGLTALGLVLVAFAVPVLGLPFGPIIATGVLALLAIIQLAVDFTSAVKRGRSRSRRQDLRLVLAITLSVILMIAGLAWLLYGQHGGL
ncbi:hypothetical protein [Rhizobium halophytocola]|uniref:Heme/copper-type cytochrome/quinol oxidase subunit 4 n=1 Tax=Rhizobium halophytocola TaxID=735519 RepID=A0ABS4DTU4_9HYPH|nr:hypothetical protein [Rhizobium halophytocola]MBP1849119.1 heme/copper-type cytochrome/quinol oxidase subunit 4 [Rhizobium halophytocola]